VSRLELKIPPDVVALLVAGLMWLTSVATPSLAVPPAPRLIAAVALFIAGLALIVVARVAFARAGTTFSPRAPGDSTRLVTSGVYRLSRNPMYVGTLLLLLGLASLLASPVSLALSLTYVAYMDRLQIRPEERLLRARFGPTYDAYAAGVRRWV